MFGGLGPTASQRRRVYDEYLGTLSESERQKKLEDKKIADNGGITLPGYQFVGPGNRVVNDKGSSSFNALPRHCVDWQALEHDVNYHNASVSDKRNIYDVAALDDVAIDNTLKECLVSEPLESAILVGGLKAKQVLEESYQNSVGFVFGDKAVYPTSSSSTKTPINWFSEAKSRNKNHVTGT